MSDLKQQLEEIRKTLQPSRIIQGWYSFIFVVQDGVNEITRGRITAEPMGPERPANRMNTEHGDYALLLGDELVGQFRLHGYNVSMVDGSELTAGVDASLQDYPNKRCTHVRTYAYNAKPEIWVPTPTGHPGIFLGPAFPETHQVWRMR